MRNCASGRAQSRRQDVEATINVGRRPKPQPRSRK